MEKELSRRKVNQAAVWSMPVAATALAVPAYAATPATTEYLYFDLSLQDAQGQYLVDITNDTGGASSSSAGDLVRGGTYQLYFYFDSVIPAWANPIQGASVAITGQGGLGIASSYGVSDASGNLNAYFTVPQNATPGTYSSVTAISGNTSVTLPSFTLV